MSNLGGFVGFPLGARTRVASALIPDERSQPYTSNAFIILLFYKHLSFHSYDLGGEFQCTLALALETMLLAD